MVPYQHIDRQLLPFRICLEDNGSGVVIAETKILGTGRNRRIQPERKIVHRHAVRMAFQHDKACILNCIVDGGGYLADAASNSHYCFSVQICAGFPVAVGGSPGKNCRTDGNLLAGHYNHVIQMSRGNLDIVDPVGGAG